MKPYLLITGASSGVGRALVHYLAPRFSIIALARRKHVMQKDFKNLPDIKIIESDLNNLEHLKQICTSLSQECINPSYIINCAGVNTPQYGLDSLNMQDLDYALNVNAKAPFVIITHFLHAMREQNFGRIINLTSGAPLNCAPHFGIYSASKALLNTLSVTLAKELIGTNIKLNLLSPGPVRSEMSPNATLEPDICFEMTDYLLEIDSNDQGGGFYWIKYKVPLFPDLEGVQWLLGKGNEKLERILDENTQRISKPRWQNRPDYSGGGYIGMAISETLAELGACVILASRDKAKCENKAKEIAQKFQVKASGEMVDITDTQSINALCEKIEREYGKLDILISNAAQRKKNTLESIDKDDWLFDMEHCLNGVFYLIKAFIPLLKQSKGCIVTIASMYGHIAPDYRIYNKESYTNPPSYGAAKAGVIQFSKYLASFLSPQGIRVNSISPGAFPYGFTNDDMEFMSNLSSKAMLNRIGTPDDLKGAVALLASDLGKFITAQNICVDGGWREW
ncbi:SDR family oxidoreductase [Helicobacter marmotae]|uniref:SDR family oxidoreductase n=1 Tax=Helicobacter marmotae TaxID=152490 RepID=UPI0018F818EE|nr:SDR family oxidoreductase [Helicobacter marmotae]